MAGTAKEVRLLSRRIRCLESLTRAAALGNTKLCVVLQEQKCPHSERFIFDTVRTPCPLLLRSLDFKGRNRLCDEQCGQTATQYESELPQVIETTCIKCEIYAYLSVQGLNAAKEGWFTELSTMWPGQGLSLKVKEVLFQQRSKFQVRHISFEKFNLRLLRIERPEENSTIEKHVNPGLIITACCFSILP
jgi:hypothetical protein